MQILAHRGYWNDQIKPNSPEAILAALEHGYGFETDVRDYRGELVISHNIADENAQNAEEVFSWLSQFRDEYCFAINIKADGLKDLIRGYLEKYNIQNYFLFDMSVPQAVEFRKMGLQYFSRQSDVEPHPDLYEDASGIWADGFDSMDWLDERTLQGHIQQKKTVCLVSPELHGRRDYREFWESIKSYDLDSRYLMLCTDVPDEAREFFKG